MSLQKKKNCIYIILHCNIVFFFDLLFNQQDLEIICLRVKVNIVHELCFPNSLRLTEHIYSVWHSLQIYNKFIIMVIFLKQRISYMLGMLCYTYMLQCYSNTIRLYSYYNLLVFKFISNTLLNHQQTLPINKNHWISLQFIRKIHIIIFELLCIYICRNSYSNCCIIIVPTYSFFPFVCLIFS